MVLYTPGRTTSYDPTPVRSGLRLHFLGGGREVGNVGCILEDNTGTRLLIDYGLAPTRPPKYPAEAPAVDLRAGGRLTMGRAPPRRTLVDVAS